MTSLHIAATYASHGDHESAQSLSYHLLPWARRSVLPERAIRALVRADEAADPGSGRAAA